MTNSEHELEFTFAKNRREIKSQRVTVKLVVPFGCAAYHNRSPVDSQTRKTGHNMLRSTGLFSAVPFSGSSWLAGRWAKLNFPDTTGAVAPLALSV